LKKKNKQKKFEEEFIQFVENRIQNTRKKLSLN